MPISSDNRRRLEDAIRRVVSDEVRPAHGEPTWTFVAQLAGVGKATADRAPDLRAAFRAALPPTMHVPARQRGSDKEERRELARLRRENRELKEATKVLHSAVIALTHQNELIARRARGGERAADNVASLLPSESSGVQSRRTQRPSIQQSVHSDPLPPICP
ncbi:MAG: hypothetical protein ACXV3F_09240 [Frankiaceae bacterium]